MPKKVQTGERQNKKEKKTNKKLRYLLSFRKRVKSLQASQADT